MPAGATICVFSSPFCRLIVIFSPASAYVKRVNDSRRQANCITITIIVVLGRWLDECSKPVDWDAKSVLKLTRIGNKALGHQQVILVFTVRRCVA